MSYSDPPPPPQYGAPQPPPPGAPASTSGMAIAALVLGILGIPLCTCLVLSILAIVFGNLGMKDVDRSGGLKTGRQLAVWGFYLGIAGVVLAVINWALVLITGADLTPR